MKNRGHEEMERDGGTAGGAVRTHPTSLGVVCGTQNTEASKVTDHRAPQQI